MEFAAGPDEVVGYTQNDQQSRRIVIRQATDTAWRIRSNFSQIPIQSSFQLLPEPRADDISRLVLLGRLLAQSIQIFIG